MGVAVRRTMASSLNDWVRSFSSNKSFIERSFDVPLKAIKSTNLRVVVVVVVVVFCSKTQKAKKFIILILFNRNSS